jgi:ankyrin repeat protein
MKDPRMTIRKRLGRPLRGATAAVAIGVCASCAWPSAAGNTPLMLSARDGNLTDVKQLLNKAGVDVNATNKTGSTALIASTRGQSGRGDVAIAKALIAKGANVNAADMNGRTALMEVAASGNLDFVLLLLDSGADPNATLRGPRVGRDAAGHAAIPGTALQAAARNGRIEVMKALLARGADVNATNELGQTALMFACQAGCTPPAPCPDRVAMVRLLIAAGADVNARDYTGKTTLSGFVTGKTAAADSEEIRSLLRDAGATDDVPTNAP